MSEEERLGAPPATTVEVVADRTPGPASDRGFLRVRRLELRNRYPHGAWSEPYAYDVVERDALDAVGIVLEAASPEGARICLRSSLRPPMGLRHRYQVPLVLEGDRPTLWEVPAGLVEPDEKGEEGLRACASRETLEEVGLEVPPAAFTRLGPAFALSPGVLAEKLWLLHAVVDPSARGTPTLDGSPTEEHAAVLFVSLREALEATRDGRIWDVKTEVAIRRLAERRGVS